LADRLEVGLEVDSLLGKALEVGDARPYAERDGLGEARRVDDRARLQRHGALEGVLELTDVARPRVRLEEPHGLDRDLLLRDLLLLADLGDEVRRERRDVLRA